MQKNWNMTKHFPQELNMNFLHKYDMTYVEFV